MNAVLNGKYSDSLIYRRHSVRRYSEAPVSQEQLDHILHSAMAAPSANNCQPWSFAVIDDRKLLDAMAEIHPYAGMMKTAPLAIVPCVIKRVARDDPFYPQDLGACVQNILLAAVECGLGSCWCGVHTQEALEKKFASLLGMPDTMFPFCVIAIGHPAENSPPSDRYDASRVRRNHW
ncbi:MAG: nitroreductase family protein [Synergistaceae bacterium]|nr:nitroreductase family protein [Synergistaceae bacterium]